MGPLPLPRSESGLPAPRRPSASRGPASTAAWPGSPASTGPIGVGAVSKGPSGGSHHGRLTDTPSGPHLVRSHSSILPEFGAGKPGFLWKDVGRKAGRLCLHRSRVPFPAAGPGTQDQCTGPFAQRPSGKCSEVLNGRAYGDRQPHSSSGDKLTWHSVTLHSGDTPPPALLAPSHPTATRTAPPYHRQRSRPDQPAQGDLDCVGLYL